MAQKKDETKVIDFYKSIYNDLKVDTEENETLMEFIQSLNAPPGKVLWLRTTAFKVACDCLSNSDSITNKDDTVSLLRCLNCIIHAIESTLMEPIEYVVTNGIPLNSDELSSMYRTLYDELNVDIDETKQLQVYFKETSPPNVESLIQTRALAFKIATEFISDNDNNKETNIKLINCIHTIVHAYEVSCLQPKSYQLQIDTKVNDAIQNTSMSLTDAVQHLWDIDANRLSIGTDFVINVQKGKKPYWKEDNATEPLFTNVDKMIWKRPTYQSFLTLLDNYSAETGQNEIITNTERTEITTFLNTVYETGPMQFCHKYCTAKNPTLVPDDKVGFMKLLHTIWFDLYNRTRGNDRPDSSGFEHVFVGEIKDNEISGFHNWIQFYIQEQKGHVDYRGYIRPRGNNSTNDDNNNNNDDETDNDDYLLTLQFRWNGIEKVVGTSFIGVSPEFEFALYTMCFLVGTEENHVSINTGTDTFNINIKCYKMDGMKVGTSFPEVIDHCE